MQETLQRTLNRLNPSQAEAVMHTSGPMLVIAGAGSGKTSVLTARIARLIEQGVPPERILALTFTRKAAEQMRTRVSTMVGDAARRVTMGTFHSVFIRFLRPFADRVCFPPGFTILDEEDSLSCLKRVIENTLTQGWPPREQWSEEMKKELKARMADYAPRQMRGFISWCKNELIPVEKYLSDPGLAQERANRPLTGAIYQGYRDICHRMCMMDYDDILLYTDMMLANNPDVLGMIAGSYDHILVDEYQDTNTAQYSILKRLTWLNKNICVVGDDSQSIYAFRGARIENILHFKDDYPGCVTVRLENNYRSTRNIVNAANNLISHNEGRIPKTCFSERSKGDPITIKTTYNDKEEAVYVADAIREKRQSEGLSYGDFAVLFRTNAQSRVIEEALVKARIPYVVYSGTAFFERMEIKDTMAYLKLAVNPHDDESFRRVANKPARGVGDSAMRHLTETASAWGLSLWDTIRHPQFVLSGLPPKALEGLAAFRAVIEDGIRLASGGEAYPAAEAIARSSGIPALYEGQEDAESRERLANIQELLDAAKAFDEETLQNEGTAEGALPGKGLAGYLENTALLSNADTGTDASGKVSIMTVHCAKGLEFDTVFIVGAEDELFPLKIDKTAFEQEEERRLFYVAMTRAMNQLVITKAKTRLRYGKRINCTPSPFLNEIRKGM